jgi:lipopolysaccharide export system protein LptA
MHGKINMRSFLKILLLVAVLFFCLPSLHAQKRKEARIKYRADFVEVDKRIGRGAQRLLDNVEFIHGGAKMYCDSAYFFSKKNSLDAFDNIFINQGDTLFLYGDLLHYDGNTKKATITGNVKLVNKETTLKTEKLYYELGIGKGYYDNYGHTVNKDNTLESIKGFYYTQQKTFVFHDSVIITNPDYVMYSDTVEYNTESGIASFFGPTDVIGDSSHIYGEEGWYDTQLDLAELKHNAWASNEKQTIYGEYIYYNKNTGDGLARDQVRILENERSVILLGNKAKYNDNTEYAFLTDSAQFIQFTPEGDSLFLHADSILSYPDTAGNKIVFAYYKVRFYRYNVQGICDSLVYSFADSTVRMYFNPVLWTGSHQVSANQIDILTKNQNLEKMYLYNASFIASKVDTSFFNQIKGKNMICHFSEKQLRQIDVMGNGQSVYFPLDDDTSDIVGVNLSECSNIKIFLENGEVHRINFYVKPNGGMYPLDQAPENKLRLKGFQWLDSLRPRDRYDIF